MDTAYIDTPLGFLHLKASERGLSSAFFCDQAPIETVTIPKSLETPVTQIREYFSNKRQRFSLSLDVSGTDFQKKVWDILYTLPFGKTVTYLEMAKRLGDPKVIRAAASANGKNPIAIIIPCHRVIGSDGSLTGYAGGLHRKKWLLDHENPVKQGVLFY